MWISHCTAAPGTSHWESCSKRWTGRSSGGSWRRPSASSPRPQLGGLIFSDSSPLILSFMEEEIEEIEPDPLISRYITGLYLQDPFYQVSRNCRRGGLFSSCGYRLPKISETTEYYNAYFAHWVVTDEVQYNVPLDGERTLCLSLVEREPLRCRADRAVRAASPVGHRADEKNASTSRMRSGGGETDRSGGGGSPALERVDIALTARESDASG